MKVFPSDIRKLVEMDPRLDSFYPIIPDHPEGIPLARSFLKDRVYQRTELVKVLLQYNQSIENDELALTNVRKILEPNSDCVVTGQQLGFLGGPIYTILKALSCLLLAREAGSIPLFWLATEDHDVEEIAQTFTIDTTGNLVRYHLPFQEGRWMVEDLILTPQHKEVIAAFFTALNPCGRPDLSFYPQSSHYALEMARLMTQLFRGTGLVFVEPRILRSLSIPFFQKELTEADRLAQIFDATTERLVKAGGTPVLLRTHSTQLFLKAEDGQRLPIIQPFDPALVEQYPERFSCNAISRPAWQNWLFPVLAYVGGPAEIAYHRQLMDYHQAHGITMPWLVPRLSASFVTAEAHRFLTKLHLHPWDSAPRSWSMLLPDRSPAITALGNEWLKTAQIHLKGLLPEAGMTEEIGQAIQKLAHRIHQTDLAHLEVPAYALPYLRNLFQPREQLQERLLNWHFFQAQSEDNLIHTLLKQLDWRQRSHLYINLSADL